MNGIKRPLVEEGLAAVYYQQMTAHGAPHQKALCVVAGKLAERLWRVAQRVSVAM
jgi:hypothetical protein